MSPKASNMPNVSSCLRTRTWPSGWNALRRMEYLLGLGCNLHVPADISSGYRRAARQKAFIDSGVVSSHSARGEASFEDLADRAPIQPHSLFHRGGCLLDAVDNEAGLAFVDHLLRRSAAPYDGGGSTRHGFDHGQSKGLRPIDGKQQRGRAAEELSLFALSNLAEVLTRGSLKRGSISLWKYSSSTASTFAAMRIFHPASRAISMARSTRFSGEIRPRNAR